MALKVFGGFRSASLAQLVSTISQKLEAANGRLLDVACGPEIFGRRIASPSKEVFGIDIAMGMLRQGAAYTVKERTPNGHLARARVEAIPFEDGLFDATICCGSLHLFADTVVALRETARAMKPSAILAVFTFTAGRGGVLRFQRVPKRMARTNGLHQIERYLTDSGFEDFQPEVSGSILTFSARKPS